MEEKESKIITKHPEFYNHCDRNKSVKKLYNLIFKTVIIEIERFEKENDIKIDMFFNEANNQLSVYSHIPDNTKTLVVCHDFSEYLNSHLQESLEYPPII